MRIIVSLTFILMVLTGCQTPKESELATGDLELQKTENDVKIYTAKDLDTAINALPFSVEFPSQLPGDIQFEEFIITENVDKDQIVLDVVGKSQDETQLIAIGITNFVSEPLNYENKDNVVSLEDNQKALYFPDNSFKDSSGWMRDASYIRWNKNDIDYIVAYKNREKTDTKETLIDLANQMQ